MAANKLADLFRALSEQLAADPEAVGMHDLATPDLQRGQATLQKLASGYARGRFDNSAVTIRGIRGLVYDALEVSAEQSWAKRLAIMLPSDTRTETHTWMGQVPMFREHFGGLLAKKINDYSLSVTNRDFETTVAISKHDWRRDKIGQITRKVGEIAVRSETHWNERVAIDVLEANATAYDSAAFFASTHAIGSSGTMANLMTSANLPALGVTTPSRPTREEAAAILYQAAAYMHTFKDDQGQPANQGAKRFMLVAPPNMCPGFVQAVKDNLFQQGGSNNLGNLGYSFEIVPEARLTATDEAYFFRTDGMSIKPILLQDDVTMPLEVEALLEGSDHWILHNEALIVAKTVRAVAPLEFRHALHLTLS